MRGLNKTRFFKELNLENLSKEKKRQIWEKFVSLVSFEVLDKILDELPQKKQEKLFSNLAKNPKKVEKFLVKTPKLRQITLQAISQMKKEILSGFKKR